MTVGPPRVAGSLWSVDPADQARNLAAAVEGGMNRVHWDHADGEFAAAGGFASERAAELAGELTGMSGVAHETHVMFTDPLGQVDAWTDLCRRIVVHVETPRWRETVARIERRGSEAALALSPRTPAGAAPDDLAVLCMSVTPGQAGSTFDRAALRKVAELAERNPDRELGLDGGVTRAIVPEALAAGATWLVVGNDLFGPGGLDRWSDVLE
ncbi:hypothetical protein [Pseudactinotalea sp. HY158]|uniref:hypothetical protein n=1 Tax=Pseudactinotalea sp. HY158 TaxID=2654547 RepID=UPI00129C5801|nr:hypothetical protein [Pseudactinotalea sp. HY158]QGH70100.1 hypothetical protein GCE65_11720 [Pseudactinotalea sp. HY158]